MDLIDNDFVASFVKANYGATLLHARQQIRQELVKTALPFVGFSLALILLLYAFGVWLSSEAKDTSLLIVLVILLIGLLPTVYTYAKKAYGLYQDLGMKHFGIQKDRLLAVEKETIALNPNDRVAVVYFLSFEQSGRIDLFHFTEDFLYHQERISDPNLPEARENLDKQPLLTLEFLEELFETLQQKLTSPPAAQEAVYVLKTFHGKQFLGVLTL